MRKVADTLIRHRPDWQHPWYHGFNWNPQKQRWEVIITPGVINGLDCTIALPAKEAPERTLKRLGVSATSARVVDCFLSEYPALALTSFRAIGSDAAPQSVSTSSDGVTTFSFEKVPAFFSAQGVGNPPKVAGGEEGLVKAYSTSSAEKDVRLLRACELVLYKDIPSSAFDIQVGDPAAGDVSILNVSARITTAPNARRRGYLQTATSYDANALPDDPLALLRGTAVTPLQDSRWISTIYFLSPPGAETGSAPDATWAPLVKYHERWDLEHRLNFVPPAVPQQLRLDTGLAGGVGDRINDFLLSILNDANSAAARFLNGNTIRTTWCTA